MLRAAFQRWSAYPHKNLVIAWGSLIAVLVAACVPATVVVLTGLQISGLPLYYYEMRQIEKSINSIPGAAVVSIGGHDDMFLEEVTARISVKGKGEIVLYGLSTDVVDYPNHVNVSEIAGRSFRIVQRNFVSWTLDIGRSGCFSRHFRMTFPDVAAVLSHYDEIVASIDGLVVDVKVPYHDRCKDGSEAFLAVRRSPSLDVDPLYLLPAASHVLDLADDLPWWDKPSDRQASPDRKSH